MTTLKLDPAWEAWALHDSPGGELQRRGDNGELSAHPELLALVGVPQDPQWHPEGDVWTHTKLVCDAAAKIAVRDKLQRDDRIVLMMSALCHDLGKATTTELMEGRWRAHGHCKEGVPLADALITRMEADETLIGIILPLVAEHLVHAQRHISKRSVRRLIK